MEDQGNLQDSILSCLSYYGLFKHPLTAEEIHRYVTCSAKRTEIHGCLKILEAEGLVWHFGGYYSRFDQSDWVLRRVEGTKRAIKLLKKSKYFVSVIASFPFVKGIAISGSLSKFYTGKNGDIDYFIITSVNRLWIARTLLHVFKKITFLTGHQHFYCMNYFVDLEALTINHQNLYTAVEINTLLPVYNAPLVADFKQINSWTKKILPNAYDNENMHYLISERFPRLKRFFEFLFDRIFPQQLNIFLMKLTMWKWKRKWRKLNYSPEDYQRAFLSTPHISKNHPVDYEKMVLKAIEKKEVTTVIKTQ